MHFPSWSDLAAASTTVVAIVGLFRIEFIAGWFRSHVSMKRALDESKARETAKDVTIADLQRSNAAAHSATTSFEDGLRAVRDEVGELRTELADSNVRIADLTNALTTVTAKFSEGIAYICEVVAMHEPGSALPELPALIKPDVMAALEKRRH